MSTFELKGQLLSIIGRLEDERLLIDILQYINGLPAKQDDLADMPLEAISQLEIAIEESYNDNLDKSHEEVMNETKLWLTNRK